MRMQGRMQTSISSSAKPTNKAVVRVAGEVEVENEVRAECGAYHNRVQIRHLLLVMQQISRSRRPLRQDEFSDVESPRHVVIEKACSHWGLAHKAKTLRGSSLPEACPKDFARARHLYRQAEGSIHTQDQDVTWQILQPMVVGDTGSQAWRSLPGSRAKDLRDFVFSL